MTNQKGLTLMELIVIIIFFGIIAATIIPKFIDLSSKAKLGSAHILAGTWSIASVENYAAASHQGVAKDIIQISVGDICDENLFKKLVGGDFPQKKYKISGSVPNCMITPTGGFDIKTPIFATQ